MFPAVLILGFGEKKRVRVPFPFFLLWPGILVGAFVLAAVGRPKGRRTRGSGYALRLKTALSIFYHLSGLRVDVRSQEGGGFYLRFI